jgi:hypothetical protein
MTVLYHLPEDAAGMLVVTFVDRANNQFVELCAWSFATKAEFDGAWASTDAAPAETAFLLDHVIEEGHDRDKYITAEWIERESGKPIAELIAAGRTETAQWVTEFRALIHSRIAA